jgi:hypothetical protein
MTSRSSPPIYALRKACAGKTANAGKTLPRVPLPRSFGAMTCLCACGEEGLLLLRKGPVSAENDNHHVWANATVTRNCFIKLKD